MNTTNAKLEIGENGLVRDTTGDLGELNGDVGKRSEIFSGVLGNVGKSTLAIVIEVLTVMVYIIRYYNKKFNSLIV